jgi:hypothetical protein
VGKISTPSDAGKTRDKIAEIVGMSGRTYEKTREVVKAAEKAPERLGQLMAEMPKSEGARGSHIKGARVDDKPALGSLGIDKNLAHQARKLAAMSQDEFEDYSAVCGSQRPVTTAGGQGVGGERIHSQS